ncbi:TonB-dependent receptor [Massilibacteroides sp.]|uniref:TonB-dependent receptor n=1 Tax=Massilibacteroides sp. TaxID=2034766 RepID=UPI00260A3D44|nr:TonB-dependent receptor [Massilibacteroides sp.]MDD4515596.1 TonB-dependent receptor [Massilibacteroides sp.]
MLYRILFSIVLLFLITVHSLAQQQTVTIEGIVLEKSSKTPLAGATIAIAEIGKGYISDESGYFKFSSPTGNYTLITSFVGYESNKTKISASTNQKLEIVLSSNTDLDEVIVTARSKDINITNLSMGVERLSMTEIKRIPALMGEVDVIKAIQLLPGVQATSEGSSGFSVRGGSPDQNLILLDNTTIYNASHLMGFFSVFNNDVISDLELYKGDIPLKHGGRLSSLLDIKTIDDIPDKTTGTGGLGLILSRLVLKGKTGKKTSWMIGGRRSYADLFLKLSSDEDMKGLTLYFYDLNAKITHRISNKDNISLNMYYGQDNFGTKLYGFKYGNLASSLTWGHSYNENLYSRIGVNISQYNYKLNSDIEGAVMTWESTINDIMLRADYSYINNSFLNLNFGMTSTLHSFTPGTVKSIDYGRYKIDETYALESSLYASNEQSLDDRWSIKYGLRWSLFQNIKKGNIFNTYQTLEPRLGSVYKLSDHSSIKANYAHNTQYIQLANSSSSNSPLDVWFLSSPKIKPQKVDMLSAGYFHNLEDNTYETSVELYYKSLKNVIDFADHADLILNKNLEDEVRTGKGKAYGAEFMVRKNKGRLNGFINYTLSRAERTIPDINLGKTYLSPYDKTNSINIAINYEVSRKITLSGIWVYATGTPATYPSGRFGIDGEYFPIYSGRNEYRKPDYHRLDLSCTYVPNPNSKKRWKSEWSFSIYNAYGRKNPYMITFDQEADTGIPYAESVYLFNMVPSITYNFKF